MNKISNVKVTGLHGFKENTVTVDFLPNKPMSFVYGFNGIGKTTVFKLLNAALNKDFETLQKIDFNTIEIKFDDDESLIFQKKNSLIDINYNNKSKIVFDSHTKTNLHLEKESFYEELNQNIKIELLSCDEYYKPKLPKLKFKEYGKLREKECEIFEDVISNPGLADKYVNINRESGELEVTINFEKNEYKTQSLEILSQGEKNLLLLYYHLIFEIPNTLQDDSVFVQLIDTPEISMHVDPLIRFYDNLCYINEELGRNENYQFVIATHSPAITYDHNELMRGMRRKNNGETK